MNPEHRDLISKSAWNPHRSFYSHCNCCGDEFSGPAGARRFIQHVLGKLPNGHIFTTIVPYAKGTRVSGMDRVGFVRAWVLQNAGRALSYLAEMGTPYEDE